MIKLKEENVNDSGLLIPKRKTSNGFQEYSLDMLYPDQLKVVLEVMGKIKEWMECEDLSKFKPLRLTVTGAGGTGKSVIIDPRGPSCVYAKIDSQIPEVCAKTSKLAFCWHK